DARPQLLVLVLFLSLLVADSAADAAAEANAGGKRVLICAVFRQLNGLVLLARFREVKVVVHRVHEQFFVGRKDSRVAGLAAVLGLALAALALLLLGFIALALTTILGLAFTDERQGLLNVHIQVGELLFQAGLVVLLVTLVLLLLQLQELLEFLLAEQLFH